MTGTDGAAAPKKGGLAGAVKSALEILAPAAVALVVFTCLLGIGSVHGSSMEPLYNDSTMTLFYRWGEVERQDIVLVNSRALNEMIIKRVVALPGDRVSIQSGVVYLNGEALDEPYVVHPGGSDLPELTVPEETVFVLGDNRAVSLDSRSAQLGPVPDSEIVGTVFFHFQLPLPFKK